MHVHAVLKHGGLAMQHRYESVEVANCMIAEAVLSTGPTSAASPLSVLAAAPVPAVLCLTAAFQNKS